MDIITYLITGIIAMFGFFFGTIISHYASEEVKAGRKYFVFLQKLTLILIFILFFKYLPFTIATILVLMSFFFLFFYWHKKDMYTLEYIILGCFFIIASVNESLHFYFTILIFLFGLFTGGMHYAENHKKRNKVSLDKALILILRKYYFFLIIIIVCYIIANIFSFLAV